MFILIFSAVVIVSGRGLTSQGVGNSTHSAFSRNLLYVPTDNSMETKGHRFEEYLMTVNSEPRLEVLPHFVGPLIKLLPGGKQSHDCKALYSVKPVAETIVWPPPREPPAEMKSAYDLDGRVSWSHTYFANTQQNGGEGYFWSEASMDARSKGRCTCGGYQEWAGFEYHQRKDKQEYTICEHLLKKFRPVIEDKRAVVVGTQIPWAEAGLLGAGAAHVTTIEYMRIITEHPKTSAFVPDEIAEMYLNNTLELFDVAWSYSSLEHDGLGRYGDPLNPTGDLESILRIRCLLKPGGYFFMGFPHGPDYVTWNSHRIYGKLRLSLIFPNWEVVDLVGGLYPLNDQAMAKNHNNQPIWVLRKPLH